jgi:hypothetical protein
MENKPYKPRDNKFEFILKVNDNIIVSRYFSGNDYNPRVRNSVDIRHLVDDIIDMIQHDLKKKDLEYMWQQYDLRSGKWLDHTKN